MKRIESITIRHRFDESPDTSHIGEYTDSYDDWAIDRSKGEYCAILEAEAVGNGDEYEPPSKGREYRFFKPYAGGEKPGGIDYQKYGKQDYAQMEQLNSGHWYYIGIDAIANVVVNGVCQRITSGGLWGIESNSDKGYFNEVELQQLGELREQLEELGFTAEQINAVKVSRKDCE